MEQFTDQLVDIAFRAFIHRKTDPLERPARLLMALPAPYGAIGKHFMGVYLSRAGEHIEALGMLEEAALQAPPAYQARSIGCMASMANSEGDLHSARVLAEEAVKAAKWSSGVDHFARLGARQVLAINKVRRGESTSALRDFLQLLPETAAISNTYEPLYLNLLNSIAVEFGAIGKLDEALQLSARTVESRYCWQEWLETWHDLKARKERLAATYPGPASTPQRAADDKTAGTRLRLAGRSKVSESGDDSGSNRARSEIRDLIACETRRGKLKVIAGLLRQELNQQQDEAIIDLLDGLWFNTGTWT